MKIFCAGMLAAFLGLALPCTAKSDVAITGTEATILATEGSLECNYQLLINGEWVWAKDVYLASAHYTKVTGLDMACAYTAIYLIEYKVNSQIVLEYIRNAIFSDMSGVWEPTPTERFMSRLEPLLIGYKSLMAKTKMEILRLSTMVTDTGIHDLTYN
jgi:hypothetical protein